MAEFEGTDLTKWKLHVDRGRQVWEYKADQSPEEQKMYDRYFLGLNTVRNNIIGALGANSFFSVTSSPLPLA